VVQLILEFSFTYPKIYKLSTPLSFICFFTHISQNFFGTIMGVQNFYDLI